MRSVPKEMGGVPNVPAQISWAILCGPPPIPFHSLQDPNPKTGHFYLGRNRTFLLWFDRSLRDGCQIGFHQINSGCGDRHYPAGAEKDGAAGCPFCLGRGDDPKSGSDGSRVWWAVGVPTAVSGAWAQRAASACCVRHGAESSSRCDCLPDIGDSPVLEVVRCELNTIQLMTS